jgi:hypothetical protein
VTSNVRLSISTRILSFGVSKLDPSPIINPDNIRPAAGFFNGLSHRTGAAGRIGEHAPAASRAVDFGAQSAGR